MRSPRTSVALEDAAKKVDDVKKEEEANAAAAEEESKRRKSLAPATEQEIKAAIKIQSLVFFVLWVCF